MIQVEGLEEAQAYLAALGRRASGDWETLMLVGADLVRFASSISPVQTGSYAGSHRAVVAGKTLTVSIDPSARNTVTGQPVTRYAGSVEARHRVYGRTGDHLMRLGVDADLAKEMVP